MKITIAQMNPIVGDVGGNLDRLIDVFARYNEDSDLIVFPELYLTGYPPRDLLERPQFIRNVGEEIEKLVEISSRYSHAGVIVGAPTPTGKEVSKGIYNSAVFIYQGNILICQNKSLLPTYDVFDEGRYFDTAPNASVVSFKDEVLGISICEDAWNDSELWPSRLYSSDPIETLSMKGATVFINISSSPFCVGKDELRYQIIRNHAVRYKSPFIFVNQVGGNDELIFDGMSMCIGGDGELIEIAPSFVEFIKTVDTKSLGSPGLFKPQETIKSVYDALILGIRDYMKKCGIPSAIIGLSGGIDSAVTCCLAKDAIGSENVLGVSMPSRYSSIGSVEDSKKLAENLGIRFEVIPIGEIYNTFFKSLKGELNVEEGGVDLALENLQARIRGNILMTLSNEFGSLVFSTGNKSELSVGYCTMYGDMSGGLSVISDVPKTMVYQLAEYINRSKEIIPVAIIKKPPSAELRPDQLDQDTLPPYDVLDAILFHHIEECLSKEEIIDLNFEAETVEWVVRAVRMNEYKRRQAAPGLKVTTKAFGVGRRMPIAARYDV
ncbi:MAG: NAD+ synthase [Halobacteriota archaeon]|nr:NAD+ synthase [Halobacteriota archaeon]